MIRPWMEMLGLVGSIFLGVCCGSRAGPSSPIELTSITRIEADTTRVLAEAEAEFARVATGWWWDGSAAGSLAPPGTLSTGVQAPVWTSGPSEEDGRSPSALTEAWCSPGAPCSSSTSVRSTGTGRSWP
jgi:hypothetical protein